MKKNLAAGFLKMLKTNNNIDERTMDLIARAGSVRRPKKKAEPAEPVKFEENMLADLDKDIVVDLDADEKTEAEQMGNPLLAGLQNNKI